MRAYCYRSGLIVFGQRVQKGAIQIARGEAKALKNAVSGLARHSRVGETLIVPGIPEATTDAAAAEALKTFIARVAKALKRMSAPPGCRATDLVGQMTALRIEGEPYES
jgi:hypothetical protein